MLDLEGGEQEREPVCPRHPNLLMSQQSHRVFWFSFNWAVLVASQWACIPPLLPKPKFVHKKWPTHKQGVGDKKLTWAKSEERESLFWGVGAGYRGTPRRKRSMVAKAEENQGCAPRPFLMKHTQLLCVRKNLAMHLLLWSFPSNPNYLDHLVLKTNWILISWMKPWILAWCRPLAIQQEGQMLRQLTSWTCSCCPAMDIFSLQSCDHMAACAPGSTGVKDIVPLG